MRILLLEDNEGAKLFLMLAGYVIAFIIGVFITRWIFDIDKIVDALKKQNDYTLVQVRLLKKMLLNQGSTAEEIDEIIQNGNQNNNEKEAEIGDPDNRVMYEELKAIAEEKNKK